MQKPIDYAHIAELYDAYVITDVDIPFFLNEAQKCTGEALELMSGTGRVSIPLIEAGVRLTCIDRSPEMVAIFRQKLMHRHLSAHIYEMDVCSMSLEKEFDLIFIPFHSFSEILSPVDQRNALASIHHHLSQNGHFICTLHNPAIRLSRVNGEKRILGEYPMDKDRILRLWTSERYNPDSHLVNGKQTYEIYDDKKKLRTSMELPIQFYLHTRNDFDRLVVSAGFRVAALYGDYSYSHFTEESSPFMIFVLRK
jgi:SAM-dependent methyltransferase